jgi:hypothetical protein
MNAPARRQKPAYAGKVATRQVVERAQAAGLDVGAIEFSPDGTIRVIDRKVMPAQASDELGQWLEKGLL